MMNYEVGDKVAYETWSGGIRVGVITEKHENVKNGQPGFSMTTEYGMGVWGYDDQIFEINGVWAR